MHIIIVFTDDFKDVLQRAFDIGMEKVT